MSDGHPIVGSVCWGGLQGYPVAFWVLLGEGQVVVSEVCPPCSYQPIDKGVEREVPEAEVR